MANVEISDTFVIFIIFGKILINIHTASNFQFSWAEFLTIFFKWFPVALHLNKDIARLQKVPKIWIFPLHNLKENIDYIFNDSTIRCRKLSFLESSFSTCLNGCSATYYYTWKWKKN